MLKSVLEENDVLITNLRKLQIAFEDWEIVVPNIGITFNNKVIELYHFYENNNVDFESSKTISVILDYFDALVYAAAETLTGLTDHLSKLNKFFFKADIISNNIMRILDIYTRIDRKLFDFDIENDIIEAIHMEFIKKLETDPTFDYEGAIREYVNELKKFNINILVPDLEELKCKELTITV